MIPQVASLRDIRAMRTGLVLFAVSRAAIIGRIVLNCFFLAVSAHVSKSRSVLSTCRACPRAVNCFSPYESTGMLADEAVHRNAISSLRVILNKFARPLFRFSQRVRPGLFTVSDILWPVLTSVKNVVVLFMWSLRPLPQRAESRYQVPVPLSGLLFASLFEKVLWPFPVFSRCYSARALRPRPANNHEFFSLPCLLSMFRHSFPCPSPLYQVLKILFLP